LRIATLAITGMLAVCVAFPAAAAKKPTGTRVATTTATTWESCHQRALSMGLTANMNGHGEFLKHCMKGASHVGGGGPSGE
jgi:hypothetical protein